MKIKTQNDKKIVRGPIRIFFLWAGIASVGLGTVGIILPLIPTTPFLLLATYCFLKSSHRMHGWLLKNKILGIYIHDYLIHKAVTFTSKIVAITFLWISLGIAMLLIAKLFWIIILTVIGMGVTIHLLTLKTRRASIDFDKIRQNEYFSKNIDRS